jgi:hypothetical protein
MLGVGTSLHSFLTSTPDADKRAIQAQAAGWVPVLFSTFWRRQNSLAPAGKFWSKNVRQTFFTCLILPVGATRSVHLIFLGLNILKLSTDEFTFLKFLIKQFPPKKPVSITNLMHNLFILLYIYIYILYI